MSDVFSPRALQPLARHNEVVVAVSSLVVVGSFFWFPIFVYYVCKHKLKTRRQRIIFFLAVAFLIYVPVKERPSLRHGWFWDIWQQYCSTTVVLEAPLPPTNVIFAMVPHGIYPFGAALGLVGRLAHKFKMMKPVIADVAFRAPIFRHLVGWMGAVGATKEAMTKALAEKKSLCVLPGGIAEMFLSDTKRDIVLLKERKGFVKLALTTGTPIVPVYVFGNNKMLKLVPFVKLLQRVSRKIRVSLVLFFGRFGLPIPFRVPLFYAVGAPIDVPTVHAPTPEQIHHFHSLVVAAVQRLHHKYQPLYQSGKILRIV